MAKDKPHDWKPVEIKVHGRKVRGTYYVENGIVTVTSLYGEKSKQVGNSSPESIARLLLRNLHDERN
jgi:hypothetical protein